MPSKIEKSWIIAQKDLRQFWRDKQAAVPLIIVPLLIGGALPAIMLLLLKTPSVQQQIGGVMSLVDRLPGYSGLGNLSAAEIAARIFAGYLLPSLILLIPIMLSTMSATASFVGEKERKTLEGLLQTPLSIKELVAAKVMASLGPSVLITWASCAVLFTVFSTVGASLLGRLGWLSWTWVIVTFLMVPLIALLGVEVSVAVSGRSETVRAAQNMTSFLILPVLALLLSQVFGIMMLSPIVALATSVALVIIDWLLFVFVVSRMSSERLILGKV